MTSLDELQLSSEITLPGPNQYPALLTADRVCHALMALHAVQRFRLIEFAERGGLGLRAIQARRTGLAFGDVPLVVKMHGPGVWLKRHGRRWMERPEDLAAAFGEQYAFEHADFQVAIAPSLVEEMRGFGWNTDAACAYPGEGGADSLYRGWLDGPRLGAEAALEGKRPLVTIGVAHYNLGGCLPATLASISAQTYPALEVIVVDDGSTDADSRRVFESMKALYPQFQFVSQANSGIGATRNRVLQLARGEVFLPMDADNIARPDMTARFVSALKRNPRSAAATCYFLAFDEAADPGHGDFLYSYRPVGGPRVLASMWNVYGDGNAIFRVDALREVGGFETDRDSSWEDWEVFVKLANRGHAIEVIPEFLFYYRHREAGFSRAVDSYRNQQRVLRQFAGVEAMSLSERGLLWQTLAGFACRLEELARENAALRRRLGARRHRLADWMHQVIRGKSK